MILAAAILAGLVAHYFMFKLLFGEVESFQDWLNEVYLPNVSSVSTGGDFATQVKPFLWHMSGFWVGAGAYMGLRTLFG
jgi:hypothetical protein